MSPKIIQEENFDKARKKILEEINKKNLVIFETNDDDLALKILEKQKIDVLLIDLSRRKDFQKQRNSGFNQVMAKLAKKNNVIIGINLDEIINSNGQKKQEILARVKQNIKLCNKNKLKMKFISKEEENSRNIYDLKSLGLVLGMPTWMTKDF
jgi:RNase P/RNase MRP subunit p30